jgi:hypothetical protein
MNEEQAEASGVARPSWFIIHHSDLIILLA